MYDLQREAALNKDDVEWDTWVAHAFQDMTVPAQGSKVAKTTIVSEEKKCEDQGELNCRTRCCKDQEMTGWMLKDILMVS